MGFFTFFFYMRGVWVEELVVVVVLLRGSRRVEKECWENCADRKGGELGYRDRDVTPEMGNLFFFSGFLGIGRDLGWGFFFCFGGGGGGGLYTMGGLYIFVRFGFGFFLWLRRGGLLFG